MPQGFDLFALINLSLSIYMLWMVGSFICSAKNTKQFFTAYFVAGIAGGIGAFLGQMLIGQSIPYGGPSYTTFALLLAWTAFNPKTQFSVFLAIPVRAKTLFASLFWIMMAFDLSRGDYPAMIAQFFGVVAVYFYTIFAWRTATSYEFLEPVDEALLALIRKRPGFHSVKYSYTNAKIFDISTGEAILTDEQYLESLQEKQKRFGNPSLTWREKMKLKSLKKKFKK